MNIEKLAEIAKSLPKAQITPCGIICSAQVAGAIKSSLPHGTQLLPDKLMSIPVVIDNLMRDGKAGIYYSKQEFDKKVEEINTRNKKGLCSTDNGNL